MNADEKYLFDLNGYPRYQERANARRGSPR